MTNIGDNIKKIREFKNLTQEAMALQLGVSQKTYSNIENAGNNITYEKIVRIAELLEVDISTILELNLEAILSNTPYEEIDSTYKYPNEEQIKLYERLLAEKDQLIELLKKKIRKC